LHFQQQNQLLQILNPNLFGLL